MYQNETGYLSLLKEIMEKGKPRGDRTKTGTRSIFSSQLQFDLQEGFPLLTTKKMAWKSIVGELLWFMGGYTDLKSLRRYTFGEDSSQNTIWDADINRWINETHRQANEGGRLYGIQWREFGDRGVDQLSNCIYSLQNDPESRRILIDSWDAEDVELRRLALPPCHFAVQFYVEDGKLNCKWNQRSVDAFLGLPFNIASYALLTHILADWCDLEVGMLIGDLTNVHIYETHVEAVEEQLQRVPLKRCGVKLPKCTLEDIEYFEVTAKDFELVGYESYPAIKAPMAY